MMVAAIQLAIMLGAALGRWLLDRWSIFATCLASVALLACAAVTVRLLNAYETDEPSSSKHEALIG